MGIEGKAREEIMLKIIKNSWIRIRFVEKPTYWTVQFYKLDKMIKENIIKWVKIALKNKILTKYDELNMIEIKRNLSKRIEVSGINKNVNFSQINKKSVKQNLKL
jgi:hypothetical protein